MAQHEITPYPTPMSKPPLFVNEPQLIDQTLFKYELPSNRPDLEEPDNIRVYIPMDINKQAILRRLDDIIRHYGAATERNEFEFSTDVAGILSQLELYDQILCQRQMPPDGRHCEQAASLAADIIARLEAIPDGCAECFPFETMEALQREYFSLPE